MQTLHVEYAEREKEYGILLISILFCEYVHLEYVRIHVIYRVNQAEYIIHIRVVAPQEYVNIYSTRRVQTGRGREVGVVMIQPVSRGIYTTAPCWMGARQYDTVWCRGIYIRLQGQGGPNSRRTSTLQYGAVDRQCGAG